MSESMDESMNRFLTNSFEETRKLGGEFARSLLADSQGETLFRSHIVALYGDLGSGKTTFTQGLAKGLGIQKRIISPTFIVVRKYRIKNQGSRIKNFYHIDLYRLNNEKDVEGLGLEEIIGNPQNIVVIEWAEKMRKFLPQNRIDVRFEYLEKDKRKITVVRMSS